MLIRVTVLLCILAAVVAFGPSRMPARSMSIRLHHNKNNNNNSNKKEERVYEIILDEKIPVEARKIILEQQRSLEKATAETAIAKAEAEKSNLLRDLDSLTNSLAKAQTRLNCMTPRAVLEYVEQWVMDNSTKAMAREDRWQTFLTDTKNGKIISECLLRENKQWTKQSLARRIVGLYQLTSASIHEQSHDIAASKQIVMERLGLTAQAYNTASCIASTLDLSLESAHLGKRRDAVD